MISAFLFLLIVAVILFGLAAFNVKSERINLVAAGLFFWSLSEAIAHVMLH